MDQAGRSTGTNPLMTIMEQLLTSGIPVHFEITTDETLSVYLDEVLMKKLGTLLPLVEGLIPDDTAIEETVPFFGAISIPVKPIVKNLPEVLEKTIKMQVGLNLVAAE